MEGDLDEAVLRRIARSRNLEISAVHGRSGKSALLKALGGYNNAARHTPWVVLIDLDDDCECAPECIRKWLAVPSQLMRFRTVVRAIESWILADRERCAQFLGVSRDRIPVNADAINDPKRSLVEIARHSRSRKVKSDLVPTPEGGRVVGPLYTARLIGFVADEVSGWRPDSAAMNSPSLARCLSRIAELH